MENLLNISFSFELSQNDTELHKQTGLNHEEIVLTAWVADDDGAKSEK